VEDLINDFERILTMPLPQPATASRRQASNQVSDLFAHIVNNDLNPLRNEIVSLKAQLNRNIKKVDDFQVKVIDPNIKCETSFEIIKSVREFKGEEDKYMSWRESAEIAMGQHANVNLDKQNSLYSKRCPNT